LVREEAMTDKVTKSVTSKRKPPAKGGSRKGIPNKITGELKQMILTALDQAGGVEYLAEKAESHPQAFMALIGRVLPMTVSGDPDNPLAMGLTVTFK
jgi:hypothetical protein